MEFNKYISLKKTKQIKTNKQTLTFIAKHLQRFDKYTNDLQRYERFIQRETKKQIKFGKFQVRIKNQPMTHILHGLMVGVFSQTRS